MGKTVMLHLSDFHIRDNQGHPFDQEVVLDPLIDRVKTDRDQGLAPELVFVTGDLAFKGDPKEYEIARDFLGRLCSALDLAREKVLIVPGNHDVNRKRYRPKDLPEYEDMRELNLELEDPGYRADLFKGLKAYFDFIDTHHSHLESIEDHLVPFVQSYETRCGKHLGIMGLNSAWKCRQSPDQGVAAIGEFQIKTAKKAMEALGACDLHLACFHHPLDGLWKPDQIIARKCLNDCIILTGHLHETGGGLTRDISGAFYACAAGGAYLGSDSRYPMGYQYLTIDWDKGCLIQDFRAFDQESRSWFVDGRKGQDGTSAIPCSFIGCDDGLACVEIPTDQYSAGTRLVDRIPEVYWDLVREQCHFLEADYLQEKGNAITLSLPELFVPLYADDPDFRGDQSPGDKEDTVRMEKEKTPVDLEALIAGKERLVIAGKPGSGKTTLLKHMAHTMAGRQNLPQGISGFFPALIFLKRLSHGLPEAGLTLEDIFNAVYAGERQELGKIVLEIARQGQCLFMLDGLDEIGETVRNALVSCLGDFSIRYPGNKYVLAGRPHGISARVKERFGQTTVTVNDIGREQIALFVEKWFSHLFAAQPSQGRKRSDDLLRQMDSNDQLSELVDTPLMLTAVCILYHHGKRLPKHRAELYQRFIDHLIHSRFDEAEKVKGFLAGLAYQMQEKGRAEADCNTAVDVLREKYTRMDGESREDYRIRIRAAFDRIEPRCGLLEQENGALKFSHLTFQEFLAAVHIMDTRRNYADTLAPLWYLDHYRETLALFIALLSLNTNKVAANDLVKTGLNLSPQS